MDKLFQLLKRSSKVSQEADSEGDGIEFKENPVMEAKNPNNFFKKAYDFVFVILLIVHKWLMERHHQLYWPNISYPMEKVFSILPNSPNAYS